MWWVLAGFLLGSGLSLFLLGTYLMFTKNNIVIKQGKVVNSNGEEK